MNDMKLSARGEAFIKSWEGLRLIAYLCGAGRWTIGWGHTGPEVHAGLRWSRREADEAFSRDTDKFERAVNTLITRPMTQNQFDALVSLCYNIGPENFRISTLRRKFNGGDIVGAWAEFKRWNKKTNPKTKRLEVEEGLTNRRRAEAELFNDPN